MLQRCTIQRVTGTTLALLLCLAASACADDSYVIGFGEDAGPSVDPVTSKLITTGQGHLASAACTRGPPTCPGATWPTFAAPDFQPASALHGESHGLEVFKGRLIIVAMLAAW